MDLALGFLPMFYRSNMGGGVVEMEYELEYWSVLVALNRLVKVHWPLGFDRWESSNLWVVASKVLATHRAKETPMPAAPSPLFSIEPESSRYLDVLLRFTKQPVGVVACEMFCRIMTEFGCQAETITADEQPSEQIPECSLPKAMVVFRIRISPGTNHLSRVLAFVVFAGITVHSTNPFLWVVSLCGPFANLPPAGRRALQFPPRARPTRTANDW